MKKFLIIGTIALIAALMIGGALYPDSPLLWLASTSLSYEIARAVLIAILAILLFSNPPRAMYFRFFLAGCAASLGVATIALLFTFEMNLFDAIVFMEIAIIFAIEALESPEGLSYPLKTKHTA